MRADRLWPAALITVLVLTVALNIYVYRISNGAGAPVVEPDYYHKAVTWDSTLAEDRASDALAWKLDARIGNLDARGRAALSASLEDSKGQPLRGASVTVEAISNLGAGEIRGALVESAPGNYSAELALPRAGMWELRIHAMRGRERFFTSVRRDVAMDPRNP